jgi:Zinc-binding dehydrogenase
VGSSPRRTLERLSEDFFDFLIVDTPRSSAARCIGQSLDFLPGIRAAPLANRGQRDSFAPGDLGVSQSLRSAKNDHLGGPGLEELIWATKRFGWVVVYGQLGAMENGTPFPLGACAFRGLKVHASFRVFDFTGHPKLGLPARAEAVERAKRFISNGLAAGRFSPKIDRLFVGLGEYAAAHRYMEKNARIGKVVISLQG